MIRFNYQLVCTSHPGRVRSKNEDNFYFSGAYQKSAGSAVPVHLNEEKGQASIKFIAVFDGMGGEEAGDIASLLAAGELKKQVLKHELSLNEKLCSFSETEPEFEQEIKYFIQETCQKMNQTVCAEMARRGHVQMGSTVTLLIVAAKRAWLCNLGDSPAYLYRNKQLHLLSVEHTERNLYPAAKFPKKKFALTQFLGVPEERFTIIPHVIRIDLCANDCFLLCSDGLSDMVENEKITEVLSSENSLDQKAKLLEDLALAAGGRDNITILLMQITGFNLHGSYPLKKERSSKRPIFGKINLKFCISLSLLILSLFCLVLILKKGSLAREVEPAKKKQIIHTQNIDLQEEDVDTQTWESLEQSETVINTDSSLDDEAISETTYLPTYVDAFFHEGIDIK